MPKIEEIALKEYPRHGDNDSNLINSCRRIAFVYGAKTVINLVKGFIADLPCKTVEESVNQKMLLSRINELM